MADIEDLKSQLINNPSALNLDEIRMVPQELDKVIDALIEIRAQQRGLNAEQEKILSSAKKYRKELEGVNSTLLKTNETAGKTTSTFGKVVGTIAGIDNIGHAFLNTLKELSRPWAEVNQAAHNYGRTIGANSKAVEQLATQTSKFATNTHIGERYNMKTEELIRLQTEFAKSVGRNIQIGDKQRDSLAATSKLMGSNTVEYFKRLENLGIGLERSGELTAKMFNDASKSGISFEKYSKTVTENLTKVQSYGFKNGVEGLTAMAKRATEVNMNIAEAFKIADRIEKGGVQEAIKMGAGLQVLGGSFSQFGDPMNMLYEGLNDMEGLQERMIEMFSGMGQLKNGQVQMSTANRLRAKAAAETLGISSDEMFNMINRRAVQEEVQRQVNYSSNSALKGDAELMEYVKNTATLDKNGNAIVNLASGTKSVKEITEADRKELKALTQTEADNVSDIAVNTRGLIEKQEGFEKEVINMKAEITSGIAEFSGKVYDFFGTNNLLLKIMAYGSVASSILNLGSSLINGFKGIGNLWKSGKNIVNTVKGGKGVANMVKGGGSVANIGKGAKGATSLAKGATTLKAGTQVTDAAGGVFKVNKAGRWVDKGGKFVKAEKAAQLTKSANAATKAAGVAAKGATVASKALTAAGGAIAGGAFAGLGYLMDGSFKGDRASKNKAIAGTTGAVVGGALGSLLDPFIGPLGTALGSAAGQFVGEKIGGAITRRQNRKRSEARALAATELSGKTLEAFKNLKGDYSSGELKKLTKALKDGTIGKDELSKSLLKKLQKNGDAELIEMFGDDEAKEKFNKAIGKMSAKVEKGEMSIDNATINLANANLTGGEVPQYGTGGKIKGVSHDQGGVFINAEGGEYIIAKDAVAKNEGALDYINNGGVIEPSLLNNPMSPLSVKPSSSSAGSSDGRNGGRLEISPIKLDISGVIKLDAGGQQVDLNSIVNNPAFITELSQMIERRLADNMNGGNFKELKKNKQHTF